MPKDGRDLQKVIRALESIRGSGAKVEIELPKRIKDKVTGKLREHDVVLTYALQHHQIVMALECRDRSRPVGVDAVEAFSRKCGNTGVHRGIIVSAKGFTKTAITKATFYNIGCLSLDEVAGFDWCRAPGMEYVASHITHTHVYVQFPDGTDKTLPLITADGVPALGQMNQWAGNILTSNSDRVPFTVGSHKIPFVLNDPEIYVLVGDKRVQAVRATFTIDYTVKSDLSLFKFRKYSDATNAAPITEAAIATIPWGNNKTLDFVLSTGDDGISISVVPGKASS